MATFVDENVLAGLPKNSSFLQGISNVDDGTLTLEKGMTLPFPQDPEATWLYYECVVDCRLDDGTVVHNRLPQVGNAPDTLASCDYAAANLDKLTGGVNLQSHDSYQDIRQRMAHSRYYFNLRGAALRVGLRVPIPQIKSVGGVAVVSYDKMPQYANCSIVPGGNLGGVVLWRAQWSLWYTTLVPPRTNDIPNQDPSAHISGGVAPPTNGVQVPYSVPDDNAKPTRPGATPALVQGITR